MTLGVKLFGGKMKMFVKTLMNVAFAGVMFSLLALAAAPAYAADPINDFVKCLNGIPNHTVADAVQCVPSSCLATVTLSEESAQPACTLRDGTRLPRVIFSCPGTSSALRFRPSFSLCTNGGVINHIELGQDVPKSTRTDDAELRLFPYVQEMADIDATVQNISAPSVFDAPGNSKGCAECHDRKGTWSTTSGTVNLFLPIPPALADGTIYTNDPTVPAPTTQVPLSVICSGIANSTQLHRTLPRQQAAYALCTALAPFAR